MPSRKRSPRARSEEHTSELQSLRHLVCRLLLDTAAALIFPLSLHDALPISRFKVLRTGRQAGDVVDGAAGCAAPERERRWPLVDLDPVDRECVARIPTGIADAVAEKVAAREIGRAHV